MKKSSSIAYTTRSDRDYGADSNGGFGPTRQYTVGGLPVYLSVYGGKHDKGFVDLRIALGKGLELRLSDLRGSPEDKLSAALAFLRDNLSLLNTIVGHAQVPLGASEDAKPSPSTPKAPEAARKPAIVLKTALSDGARPKSNPLRRCLPTRKG